MGLWKQIYVNPDCGNKRVAIGRWEELKAPMLITKQKNGDCSAMFWFSYAKGTGK